MAKAKPTPVIDNADLADQIIKDLRDTHSVTLADESAFRDELHKYLDRASIAGAREANLGKKSAGPSISTATPAGAAIVLNREAIVGVEAYGDGLAKIIVPGMSIDTTMKALDALAALGWA